MLRLSKEAFQLNQLLSAHVCPSGLARGLRLSGLTHLWLLLGVDQEEVLAGGLWAEGEGGACLPQS